MSVLVRSVCVSGERGHRWELRLNKPRLHALLGNRCFLPSGALFKPKHSRLQTFLSELFLDRLITLAFIS